jgi:hypothetical protein
METRIQHRVISSETCGSRSNNGSKPPSASSQVFHESFRDCLLFIYHRSKRYTTALTKEHIIIPAVLRLGLYLT